MRRPWDVGLQPERTELAWRRTVLAVTAGTAIAARYLGAAHPGVGLVLPLTALLGGFVLLHAGTKRFRRINDALLSAGSVPGTSVMPGGGMLAAVAILTALIGVVSAAFVATAPLVGSG